MRHLLPTLLAGLLLATKALAATGLATLPPPAGSGPLTVAYPTDAAPSEMRRGPFTMKVASNAAPARGNGRLVVLSHGSGGSPWPQFDLAQALVAAGFTVAMPEHAGDNWRDMRDVGPVSWAHRPREISQAIDAIAADGRFAPLHLDLQRVGVYGMSAGGIAALTLAGARWSPARLAQHCEAHLREDFAACVGLSAELDGDGFDGAKLAVARRIIGMKFANDTDWREWSEPRVAAVVAAVPMAAPIEMASLAHPRVPLGLVRAAQDAWLAPRFHVDAVRQACAGAGPARCALLADMPQGGHGSILSPQPPDLPPAAARLLNDPPGFDRASLADVYARIVAFFVKNLAG